MRYASLLAAIALLGWAQTPAPLDRWALYVKAGDSLLGPLPNLAILPASDYGTFYLPVHAILHDRRGIDRWRWEVQVAEIWSSTPYQVSTAETLVIAGVPAYGLQNCGAEVRLWLFVGGDSVLSQPGDFSYPI